MADISPHDAWISGVLGIAPDLGSGPDGAAFEDETIGEAPVDRARSRLDDIDGVLKAVDEALELADGYQGVVGYEQLNVSLRDWTQRRAALDKARLRQGADNADIDAVHKAIEDARTLLENINDGLKKANVLGDFKAALTPEQTPKIRLASAEGCLKTLAAGGDKDTLKQLLEDANQLKGDGVTPGDGFVSGMDKFWDQAAAKASDSVRAALRSALELFRGFADSVSKLNPVNPAAAVFDALTDRALEADQLGDARAGRRLELWSATLTDTKAAQTRTKAPREDRAAAEGALYRINGKLATLPKLHTGRAEIVNGAKDVREGLTGDCAKATIEDLGQAWAKRKQDALALEQKLDTLLLTVGGGASLLKSIAAFRVSMRALELNPPTGGTPAATKYTELQKDLDYLKNKQEEGGKQFRLDGTDMGLLEWLRTNIAPDVRDAEKIRFQAMDKNDIDEALKAHPKADNPTDQAIWEAAFAARFGVDFKVPEGMKASRLPELYALFQRVPEGHSRNKSIQTVEYELNDASPAYNYTSKKIILTNLKDPGAMTQGGRYAHPGAAPDTGEDISYFAAAALHEIGHAVDDLNGLMEKNSSDDVGGWQPETLASVSAAFAPELADQFKQAPADEVQKLLTQILLTGGCVKPVSAEAPFGRLLGDWDQILPAATKIMQDVRGKSPWAKPRTAKDGRNYHEAYPARWVSYSDAKRKEQRVSDYQWRAPGEWIAELYAWYWSESDPNKRTSRTNELPAGARAAVTG